MENLMMNGFCELTEDEMMLEGGKFSLGSIIAGSLAGAAVAHVVYKGIEGALVGSAVAPGVGTVVGAATGIVAGGITAWGVSSLYDSL
jgi:hypothetical protein